MDCPERICARELEEERQVEKHLAWKRKREGEEDAAAREQEAAAKEERDWKERRANWLRGGTATTLRLTDHSVVNLWKRDR